MANEDEGMKKCAGPEAFDKEVEKRMKKLKKTVYNGTRFNIVEDGGTYLVQVGSGTVGGRFKSEKDAMTYGNSWLADQKKKGLSSKRLSSKDVQKFDYKGLKVVIVETVNSHGETTFSGECDDLRIATPPEDSKQEAIASVKSAMDKELR